MELMTVREVAIVLRLSRSQVYAILARKEMPHFRMGKRIVIRRRDLDIWLMQRAILEGMELGNRVVAEMFPEMKVG